MTANISSLELCNVRVNVKTNPPQLLDPDLLCKYTVFYNPDNTVWFYPVTR